MKRIRFFYAYAVRNVAYGESFGNTAVSLCDNDTFEVLDSLLFAFDNFVANLNRVAYVESRNFGFQTFSVDSFDDSFHLDFTSVIYETFITRCVIPHHAQKRQRNARSQRILYRISTLLASVFARFLQFFSFSYKEFTQARSLRNTRNTPPRPQRKSRRSNDGLYARASTRTTPKAPPRRLQ